MPERCGSAQAVRERPRVAVGISHFKGMCRAGTGAGSETEPGTESGTKPETEPETESGAEPGTESVAEPETESGTEPEARSGTESGAEGPVSRISPCRLCRGV